jgi:DNA-directed RNA polymerase
MQNQRQESLAIAHALGFAPKQSRGSIQKFDTTQLPYVALAPLVRELVNQHISLAHGKKGLEAIEEDFQSALEKILAPARGQPSILKKCLIGFEIKPEDGKWISHLVTMTLLQGVVRNYSNHLEVAGVSSLGESVDDDLDTAFPSAFGAALKGATKKASSEPPQSSSAEAEDNSISEDESLLDAEETNQRPKWESLQSAADHVWRNFSTALLLRSSEEKTSQWVEAALRQTSSLRTSERKQARAAVGAGQKELLKRIEQTKLDAEEEESSEKLFERTQLEFGALLIDVLLTVIGANGPKLAALKLTDGAATRDVKRIEPSATLLKSLKSLAGEVCFVDPSGPIAEKPAPWAMNEQGEISGGFQYRSIGLYKFHHKNQPIRTFLKQTKAERVDLSKVFSALNTLQETPWRINKEIWNVLKTIIKASDDPEVSEYRQEFSDVVVPNSMTSKWQEWIATHFFTRAETNKKQTTIGDLGARLEKSPGWRLISPAGAPEVIRLAGLPQFHFVHHVDSRGRVYPVGSYIQPQGEDTFRALLEFGEQKAIGTQEAVDFLALHGSQCASRERILTDLNIQNRQSPTFNERVLWIKNNSKNIVACADDPLEELWWRDVARGSEFQFLAFCFAWREYAKKGLTAQIRLPVHVDGSCNGLQHIAALTGDLELARAVNLMPSTKANVPHDIYLEVSNGVLDFFENSTSDDAIHADLCDLINQHPNILNRNAAKKVVMIIPYGASERTYAKELALHIRTYEATNPSLVQSLQEIGNFLLTKSTSYIQGHLLKRLENLLSEERNKKNSDAAIIVQTSSLPTLKVKKLSTEQLWKPLYIGRMAMARLLAHGFTAFIKEKYPAVASFKDWLHTVSDVFISADQPLGWVSPSGFPVLQNAFQGAVNEIDIRGLGSIRMSQNYLTNEIDSRRQRRAFLPNYIHSLDSAHLVLTLNGYKPNKPCFAMVHDSFGTHAVDMPRLSQTLRSAFESIYSAHPLQELSEWIQKARNKNGSLTSAEKALLQVIDLPRPPKTALPEFKKDSPSYAAKDVIKATYFFY